MLKKVWMSNFLVSETVKSDNTLLNEDLPYDSYSFGKLPDNPEPVDKYDSFSFDSKGRKGPSIFDPHIIFDTGPGTPPNIKDVNFNK
jgi:hypothetical protein